MKGITMKKKAVVLLSAAALVIALPGSAFAAAAIGAPGAFTSNSGETQVTVEVDSSNINATVPVSMTVVAKTEGGACTVPSGYKIVNNTFSKLNAEAKVVDAGPKLTYTDTFTGLNLNEVSMQLNGTQLTKVSPFPVFSVPASTGTAAAPVAGEQPLAITATTGPLSFNGTQTNTFKIQYTLSVDNS